MVERGIFSNMKNAYYFIRTYWSDFIASILAITLAWITFSYTKDLRLSFIISTGIILFFLFVIIYLRSKEKDFYFIALQNREDREDWIGDGKFDYSRVSKCFQVTQASPGYIYSKCLNWSDYKYEFEFKLRKQCLGAVLRAVNLSNYVMLQITQSGIRPHVLINGGWIAWEANTVNLEFPKNLSFEEWYKCELVCDKDIITIKMFNKNNLILDREWQIPHGVLAFAFKKDEDDTKPLNIPFPINLEYGSVGFRNFGDEKAFVKNILIEKV